MAWIYNEEAVEFKPRIDRKRIRAAAVEQVALRSRGLDLSKEEFEDLVREVILDWLDEDARELYEARQLHDDSPSLANCDDSGSGEGRFHGRM